MDRDGLLDLVVTKVADKGLSGSDERLACAEVRVAGQLAVM